MKLYDEKGNEYEGDDNVANVNLIVRRTGRKVAFAIRPIEVASEANRTQIGGDHYKAAGVEPGEEHWDRAARLQLDYFQSNITKYIERCKLKNGLQDVEKAFHYCKKYIELIKTGKIPGFPIKDPRKLGMD